MNPVVNKDSTTWRARIKQAMADGIEHGGEEHQELYNLAATWSNCAVGERREVLKEKGYPFTGHGINPLEAMGVDVANPVHDLGMAFMDAVAEADWQAALDILDKLDALPEVE